MTVAFRESDAPAESVTLAVKLNPPTFVTLPETVPSGDKLRPAGSAPLARDQLYGRRPPAADRTTAAYGRPISPLWNGRLAMASGAVGLGEGEGSALGELDGVAVLDETSFGGAAQPDIASRRTTIPYAQPLNTIFAARSLEGSAAI